MNILDELVAKGVAGDVIVAVAQLIADAKLTQDRRTKNAERMKSVRTHAHTSMHTETQETALTVLPSSINNLKVQEERLEIVALAPAPKNRRRPLPDDWEPIGEQRDPAEADEFRDHARAKGYQYIDWHAAYRNFQKSQYNARNQGGQNGRGRRHGSVLDALDRIGERLKAAGASDDYIPGSSGPRPLELDTPLRPTNLKLVSKG